MKIFLLVSDFADRSTRHVNQFLAGDRTRAPNFPSQHDMIRRDQRLNAAARLRLRFEKGIDNRIRNAVTNLVGVTFRYGFAGEHEIAAGQSKPLCQCVNTMTYNTLALIQPCPAGVKLDFCRVAPAGRRDTHYFPAIRSAPPASALAKSNKRRRKDASSIL